METGAHFTRTAEVNVNSKLGGNCGA